MKDECLMTRTRTKREPFPTKVEMPKEKTEIPKGHDLPPYFHFMPFIIAIGLFLVVDLAITFTPIDDKLSSAVENNLANKLVDILGDDPKNIDVLAVGTSRTNYGISSNDLEDALNNGNLKSNDEINVYNMGLPGGSYYMLLMVLKNHIKEFGKPKVVVLETTEFLYNRDFKSDNNILYYRTLINGSKYMDKEIMGSASLTTDTKQEIMYSRLSGLYRYRSILSPQRLAKIILKNKTKMETFEEGWRPRGIGKEMSSETKILTAAKARKRRLIDGFDSIDLANLEEFLDYCDEQGIEVVMFELPSHPSYQTIFESSEIGKAYYREVHPYLEKRGVPLVDMRFELPKENVDPLFSDTGHLSIEGAHFFSERLGQTLAQKLKHVAFNPKSTQ